MPVCVPSVPKFESRFPMPPTVQVTVHHPVAFKPKGQPLSRIVVVFVIRSSEKLKETHIKVANVNVRNIGDFVPSGKPNFKVVSEGVAPYEYHLHVSYSPPNRPRVASASMLMDAPVRSSASADISDLTFSIEIGVGTVYPPFPASQPVPIIEIDPCSVFAATKT
jgi:hypothetical protein